MPICGGIGCANRPGKSKSDNMSFYKTPKIIYNQGESTREISEERRQLWKAAMGRRDILSEAKWDRTLTYQKQTLKGVDERGQVTGRQCGVACSGRRHGQMVKGIKKYHYH
ncbi:hypothetical protein LSH36_480g02008 [Paralvinella palmiformis]|uniref:Uncharacterized protein n=1 Tax=Paralvinella palmiformis TaxID=53620 RepID=A0AAD9J9W9_9ANNE|nr:hypothetical protein LSH36_480g02008 [Paralvinella palmiformis]